MELQEHIEWLQKDYQGHYDIASSILKKLEKLRHSQQPSNEELYKHVKKYVDIEISTKDYMYILGGDGRSAPWDEKRNGVVADIKLKEGIYLSAAQLKIVEGFVNNTEKVDCINIFE